MSFATIKYSLCTGLYYLSVFYVPADDRKPTSVSTNWHRTRASAVRELSGFFG